MSFLVDKLAKHAGDIVADKIKSALGGDDDKDDKEDKDGGFLSIFKRDKDDDDHDRHKGGLFSFGKDDHHHKDKDKDKDKDKGNFFQNLFDRDDDDRRGKVPKKSGFHGLFSEQEAGGGARSDEAGGGAWSDEAGGGAWSEGGAGPDAGPCAHMTDGDLDLMSDLMEVANENS
ncbi:prostatic spermine-binding protein-like [Periophthalmus magnuspinnatus]|uniref:prostatic spermine-binding protein-like n=1 Tax=Periophthalmus magnuspinnatus TaxID=409849 RepID=UPI002436A71B|nr:prostatic spermine-binding protein-like [Periophthalmus magnuspinnatus]